MAEAIGVASGLLTLATFTIQSSRSLYQAIKSFQNNHRTIRELTEELEALTGVLESLQETATSNYADLKALKLPLFRCGKACADFEQMIQKFTVHSNNDKRSFRDWARLKYMGDDVTGFKNMLAGYKSTISIALADINLRRTAVTVGVLAEYKTLIDNTTVDLNDHLQDVEQKLQGLSLKGSAISEEEDGERNRIFEEKDSTKQCLRICDWVSNHIDQVEMSTLQEPTISGKQRTLAPLPGDYVVAKQVTADVFKACREKLNKTSFELEKHLHEINTRIDGDSSNRQTGENDRIEEERNSIAQCIAICAEAAGQVESVRTNVFEDVSAAEEAHQVAVATLGDLVLARRVTVGNYSAQWLGQMSDASLQQLSRDRSHAAERMAAAPQSTDDDGEFEGRYGAGKKLASVCLTGRSNSLQAKSGK